MHLFPLRSVTTIGSSSARARSLGRLAGLVGIACALSFGCDDDTGSGLDGSSTGGSSATGGDTSTAGENAMGGESSMAGGSSTGGTPSADGVVGYFFGPIGSEVRLSVGSQALRAEVAAPDGAEPMAYNASVFQTPEVLDPSATYEVSVTAATRGQLCGVFAGAEGTGEELSGVGAIRIGCEWGFDLVGRSSDDQVLAYSNNSKDVVVGGSSRAIGGTEPLGDGRVAVFRSSESGLVAGAGAYENIYARDRLTGVSYLVSRAHDGGAANGSSWRPAVSANGLFVAFHSSATNLVEGDTNGVDDVFVWSALDETLTRVSVGPGGEEGNGASRDVSISGDGQVVAFVTGSTTVVPTADDGQSTSKVVRIDLKTGERSVISRNKTSGTPADASWPMLSEDGNRLVFYSYRDVDGDLNPYHWDIFVYEHDTGNQWSVSQTQSGANRNQGSESVSGVVRPSISGDGKWVTYGTSATNVVPGVTDSQWHVYLVEVDACSGEGCNVVVVDRHRGALADKAATSGRATLTHDGSYVVFTSVASNLGVDNNKKTNAFVYSREENTLVPLTTIGEGYGGTYTDAVVSPDGGYVGVGAYLELDPRFDTDGLFVAYTGLTNAFSWLTGAIAGE